MDNKTIMGDNIAPRRNRITEDGLMELFRLPEAFIPPHSSALDQLKALLMTEINRQLVTRGVWDVEIRASLCKMRVRDYEDFVAGNRVPNVFLEHLINVLYDNNITALIHIASPIVAVNGVMPRSEKYVWDALKGEYAEEAKLSKSGRESAPKNSHTSHNR